MKAKWMQNISAPGICQSRLSTAQWNWREWLMLTTDSRSPFKLLQSFNMRCRYYRTIITGTSRKVTSRVASFSYNTRSELGFWFQHCQPALANSGERAVDPWTCAKWGVTGDIDGRRAKSQATHWAQTSAFHSKLSECTECTIVTWKRGYRWLVLILPCHCQMRCRYVPKKEKKGFRW